MTRPNRFIVKIQRVLGNPRVKFGIYDKDDKVFIEMGEDDEMNRFMGSATKRYRYASKKSRGILEYFGPALEQKW